MLQFYCYFAIIVILCILAFITIFNDARKKTKKDNGFPTTKNETNMKKFKLKSKIVKSGTMPRKCIEVYSASDSLLCLIYEGVEIAPQPFDFELKEMEYFVDIAKKFYTTFENLELMAAKDEEIKNLTAIVRHQETEIENIINQSVNH